MSTFNKVPATAGAEWLLGGFALLRKAPLALGVLGVMWGLLSLLVMQVLAANMTVGLLLQVGLGVLQPLLFAGVVWAVREVEHDRPALPGHLLHGFGSGRAASLLSTLLPQVVSVLALGALLLLMIGPAQVQQMIEAGAEIQRISEAGGQPDPALVRDLPVGRFLLWILLMVAAVIATALFTFVAVPEILLGGKRGLEAMRNSFGACVHNLPALLVFAVLLLISLLLISLLVQLVALVVQLAAGPVAGLWVANLLLMGVLMPLLAGAVYHAWRQLLGTAVGAEAPPPAHFEA